MKEFQKNWQILALGNIFQGLLYKNTVFESGSDIRKKLTKTSPVKRNNNLVKKRTEPTPNINFKPLIKKNIATK